MNKSKTDFKCLISIKILGWDLGGFYFDSMTIKFVKKQYLSFISLRIKLIHLYNIRFISCEYIP